MKREAEDHLINEKKKDKAPHSLISMAVGLAGLVFFVFFFSLMGQSSHENSSVTQDQPFDVTVGEDAYPAADLDSLRFTPVKAGTQIRYSARLKGEVNRADRRVYENKAEIKKRRQNS